MNEVINYLYVVDDKWTKSYIFHIYCTRLPGNLLETFSIDSYDKNACKRAQEHCLTRSGAEP